MFGMVILPLAFWFITRRKPTEVARGFSRALALAFGTSSSSAALPVSTFLVAQYCCDIGSYVSFAFYMLFAEWLSVHTNEVSLDTF